MHVLVMGGTRLMGLQTVLELLRRGHAVSTFNRGSRTIEWPAAVRELRGDRDVVADLAQIADLEPEGLIDFSAYSSLQTQALLDVAGDVPRLVHCSTGAVYRPDPVLPWSEMTTPTGPWSVWGAYGREKLRSEELLREHRGGTETATTLLRPPMVLSPANYVAREEWVLNRLLDHAEILVPGDGRAVSHFVASDQVASFAVNALEAFSEGGVRAFNVAEPSALASALGFIDLCAAAAGRGARVRHVASTRGVFDVTDNVFPFPSENYILDTRAAQDAGLQPPARSLEAMIGAAYEHLQAHPERRAWTRSAAEAAALESTP